MIIKKIELQKWNQFEYIDIDFHPNLTIITGANGSGKSSIIRMIGRTIGWEYRETATPITEEIKKRFNLKFLSGLNFEKLEALIEDESEKYENSFTIGSISTEIGSFNLNVPKETTSPDYNLRTEPVEHIRNGIPGVNIPSHKLPYKYKKIDNIPVKALSKDEAYNEYINSFRKRYISAGYYNPLEDDPSLVMKKTLISLAVFGKGNEFVNSDSEAYSVFLGFIEILKLLLPPTLGFIELNIRDGEIILITETGEFLLDAVSGGIGSIIDLAWQIYMYNKGKEENFVVLIDEIENHLHPSLQRRILPSLLKAFPSAQFIVSTHSPFIVNSVKESKVYALKYNNNKLVFSHLLDFKNKAGNASEILREVLGVPVTMPIWVEEKLNNITDKFRGVELTVERYNELKNELESVGLSDHLPQALTFFQGGKSE